MTQQPPTDVPPPVRPVVAQWYMDTGAIVLRLGFLLGLVRAVAVIADGKGKGVGPWLDAAYLGGLHVVAAYLIVVPIRAVGDWLAATATARPASPSPSSLATPVSGDDEASPASRPEPVPISAAAAAPPSPRLEPGTWRARIDASRDAGDAVGVVELREQAPEAMDEAELRELDVELGRWYLGLVHRRLRSGPLQLDLVGLVERVSEVLGHTREGASLHAALPTLRRGAGLCPRCAKPYTGVWEACPECMGRPEPPPPEIPGLDATDVDDLVAPASEGRWFIDPDEEADPDGPARR